MIRGTVASRMYVTTADGSDSPAVSDDRRRERIRALDQRDARDDEARRPADRQLGDRPRAPDRRSRRRPGSRSRSSPTASAGTVPTRSTVAWFVYGSSGCSRAGASERTPTVGDGTGVAVRSPTKPANVAPTASATLPSPPVAVKRTPADSAARATMKRIRNGSARPLRSLDPAMAGDPARRGLPRLDLDRRRPTGRRRPGPNLGRSPAAPSRHRLDCRTLRWPAARRLRSRRERRSRLARPGARWRVESLRSDVVLRGRRAGRSLWRALLRDGVQARDRKSDRPSAPTGRPAFGVGPIARVAPSPLARPDPSSSNLPAMPISRGGLRAAQPAPQRLPALLHDGHRAGRSRSRRPISSRASSARTRTCRAASSAAASTWSRATSTTCA